MKKAGWFFAIALLLVSGLLGILNGIRERSETLTTLQHSVTVATLVYGVLGLAAAYGLLRRRRWSVGVTLAWAAATTYTGTVASFAFHDPSLGQSGTLMGALGALIGTAAIGALVVWSAHVATKPAPTASTA